MSSSFPSRFFAVKTTGGQEKSVASFVALRLQQKQTSVYSIVVLDNMKGYVFVEAPNAQVVTESVSGFKHVKGQIPGIIPFNDIEQFLTPSPVITELKVEDIVELMGGPFKGMRARVTRVELGRSEATIILLDAPYQLPVTVDAAYLKVVEKAKSVVQ